MKTYKLLLLLCSVWVFAACGGDDDPTAVLEEKEQAAYDKYVTAEMEEAIQKLNIPINRGIDPPAIEGYYRMEAIFKATTNSAENSYLGRRWDTDLKLNFYDQKDLQVSLHGYEVYADTDVLSVERSGVGTFITGENDKFSIFMEESGVSGVYTSITLTVISGEVVRSGNQITGIKNILYAFIMKDTGGRPDVIAVGQGRVFGNDLATVITQDEFKTLTKSTKSEPISSGLDLSFD